jgi:hypothetical protein
MKPTTMMLATIPAITPRRIEASPSDGPIVDFESNVGFTASEPDLNTDVSAFRSSVVKPFTPPWMMPRSVIVLSRFGAEWISPSSTIAIRRSLYVVVNSPKSAARSGFIWKPSAGRPELS